eukprot:9541496-Ditylum_brightwellii.AAC.1
MQQWRALKKKGVRKPDPRKQFLKDLTAFIDELLDKEHKLVLLLDVNEDTVEAGNFKGFIDENDLIDVYRHLHPDSHPATYLRGNKQLDYVRITQGLLPAVLAAGYLPFHT